MWVCMFGAKKGKQLTFPPALLEGTCQQLGIHPVCFHPVFIVWCQIVIDQNVSFQIRFYMSCVCYGCSCCVMMQCDAAFHHRKPQQPQDLTQLLLGQIPGWGATATSTNQSSGLPWLLSQLLGVGRAAKCGLSCVNNWCNVDYDEKYMGRESRGPGSAVQGVLFYIRREQVVAAGKVTLSGPLFEVPFENKCAWWRTRHGMFQNEMTCYSKRQIIGHCTYSNSHQDTDHFVFFFLRLTYSFAFTKKT